MTLPRKLAVVAEEAASGTNIVPVNDFHLEPRCHVCRNDRLRVKVNHLLAQGASYAYIVRALEDDNASLHHREAGQRDPAVCKLLDEQTRLEKAAARAPVFLRNRQTEKPHVGQLGRDLEIACLGALFG